MSSVGKVFIIVNLILAALFVGAAASLIGTSGEYRAKHDEAQNALTEEQEARKKEVSDLNSLLTQEQSQTQSKVARVNELEADKKALDGELETERQQNADLRESFNGLNAKLGDLEQTNRTLNNQKSELEREARTLREERDAALDERDAAASANTKAQEQARIASNRAQDLDRELGLAQDKIEELEATISTIQRKYNIDMSEVTPQPNLEGLVLSASFDNGAPIVILNLGKKDGVKPGYTFDVFRGSTYKGRVIVEIVNENNSACTLKLSNPQTPTITSGDRVATNA